MSNAVRFVLLSCLFAMLPVPAVAAPARWMPGEILVMMTDGDHALTVVDGRARTANPALAAILERHGLARTKDIRGRGRIPVLKLLSTHPEFDAPTAARELTASGLVRAASPNYVLGLCVLPNDPMLGTQWHIQHAGDADIDLPEAWDVAQGEPGTVIAILDTGLDWSHPDLQASAWQNTAEAPGNGLDDDGNGWIDDRYGWDVGNDDNDARPEVYLEQGIDVGFHGTHCAGIAGASTNNGTGIAGAGWGCRLMGLKMNDSDGNITTEGLAAGFDYAVSNGAAVISMSFGGELVDFGFMQALVDDAAQAGVVCVAAAGNNGNATPLYPAALDGVIAVGATSNLNQRASFSSYGPWVDVAAPGEQIWSTVQSNYSWDFLTQILFSLLYGWNGTPYMYSDGTSMACPLVAGVCGLIKSVRPDFTPEQVRERLVATGDVVAWDQPIGVKVNAFAALNGLAASAAPPPANESGRIVAVHPNPLNPATRIEFSLAAAGHARLSVLDLRGRLVRVLVDAELAAGAHGAGWDGRDSRGRPVASGVYTAVLDAGGAQVSRQLTLVR